MPSYSQDGHVFRLTTPLGKDVLLLRGFRGTEAISELFDLELDLVSENESDVRFEAVVGQGVTISVDGPDGAPVRWFHGLCSELEEGGRETLEADKKTFTAWRMRVVPKVAMLGLVHRSRVFQESSVPDILRKVFSGYDVDYDLTATYDPRETCLQYRESDLSFAFRLLEEEGIRFHFRHADGSHTMVLSDQLQRYTDLPGVSSIRYEPVLGGVRDEDRITGWRKRQALTRGKVTIWDRSFEMPAQTLEKQNVLLPDVQVGTVAHRLQLGEWEKRELYAFPGGHAKPYDGVTPGGGDRAADLQKIFPYGDRRVRVMMEREEARAVEIEGEGHVRHLSAGWAIALENHHDGNGRYLVTRVVHHAENGIFRTDGSGWAYENSFTCLPAATRYRAPRSTARPVAQGPETAIVVGPQGEEIYVDKYARVKVQFYWDREGKRDPMSSAWLRVATPLAGTGWGSWAVPRIGQEVLVDFLHGDPDEPVVVGALYNAANMPPQTLPENKSRTGLRTRSTLGGTSDEFHEVYLEDRKGQELFYVQSQKDFHRLVKNNDRLQVGVKQGTTDPPDGSQAQEIWKNRTVNVAKGDDALAVGRLPGQTDPAVSPRSASEERQWDPVTKLSTVGGNQTIWVANDRTRTVCFGNDKLVVGEDGKARAKGSPSETVHQGNQVVEVLNDRTATIRNGNDKLKIARGNLDIELTGSQPDGKVTIVAPHSFELKVGTGATASLLKLDPSAVELKFGTNLLKIDASAAELKFGANSLKVDMTSAELKTATCSVKLDAASATLKGITATLQGMGTADVKAPIVNVKGDGITNVGGALTKIG